MFELNREALEYIFEGLRSGFRRSPREIFLFILMLAGFVCFLAGIYFFQKFWRRSKKRKQSARRFDEVVEEKQIPPEEARILLELARKLFGWRERLAGIVTDPHLFNRAAQRYLRENPEDSAAIAALRLKIGFSRSNGEKTIRSSAELAEGLKIYLCQDSRHSFHGTVTAQKPRAMVVEVGKNGRLPSPGDQLQVYFLRKNGVFFFSTRVQRVYDHIVQVEHTEQISRVQRRQFYRSRVSLPVEARKKGSSQPVVRTYIIELGGGGATLFNPYKVFHPGSELLLHFRLPQTGMLRLAARALRCSRGGNHLHVEFEPLKDPLRDKILGFILNRAVRSG